MEKETCLYFKVRENEDEDAPLSVYASKLGGTPYLPKKMEYPRILEGAEAGRPLELLAQLNFEELPKVKDFPETGILQFYVGGENIGKDSKNRMNQNGFRVIYHETISKDESLLYAKEDLPEFPERTYSSFDNLPFCGEYSLLPEDFDAEDADCDSEADDVDDAEDAENVANENITGGDATTNVLAADGNTDVSNRDDEDDNDDDDWDEEDWEDEENDRTCIGGCPYFTQYDPRGYNERYAACDVLLFQLSSGNGVMWGDFGVGNFFISREDLKKKDFSNVLYYWDCT